MISIFHHIVTGSVSRFFVTALAVALILVALPATGAEIEHRAKISVIPGDGEDVGGYEGFNFEELPKDVVQQRRSSAIRYDGKTVVQPIICVGLIWVSQMNVNIMK